MCAGLKKRMLGFLLLLLPLSGVCTEYRVEYPQAIICAVKNSSVLIPCSFFFPSTLVVHRVMWGHERNDIFEGPFLFDSDNFLDPKFQYHGDKKSNCSLIIHQISRNDSGKYTFRFVTNDPKGKFTGVDGSMLKVADLSVLPPSINETKEGGSVRLTCQSSCKGAQQSFTWFKDGGLLSVGPVLDLSPLSLSDSGNYSCSLSAHPGLTSGVKHVDVEYGPKSTSAGPPREVDGGRNVSLVCSSRANPPVQSYVWFRIKDGVQQVGNQSVLVTGEDGEYLCRATNKHGSQNSSAVTVVIKGNWPYAAHLSITVATLLIVIAIVVAVILKKTTRAAETQYRHDFQNPTSINHDAAQSANTNQEMNTPEMTDIIYATVHFASSREKQKELTGNEVIYCTVQI